ncbi:MAG: arginyltransferase [Alphaproteobacteria bacterium]|nr:arginyltransferase [Alphaproteobacteria bacterium]
MLIPEAIDQATTFYLSGLLPCPYLAGQMERKLFAKLSGDAVVDGKLNGMLTQAGFRRSHDVVYRPACPACQACVPVRVPVAHFAPSRSQRRADRRNQDLAATLETPEPTAIYYALFQRYQAARHAESDMVTMSEAAFRAMISEGGATLQLLTLRDAAGALQGVLLADRLPDGFSAVYSFYNPDDLTRGLGTFLVLQLLAAAQSLGLPYVYLGYWIAASPKMAYKALFQPQEHLTPEGWR